MMLTTSFFPTPMHHYLPHTPPRPSPLGERSVNAAPRLFDFNMASQDRENTLKAPQRAFKPNPVLQTRDAATKRRRDMFFRRVQNDREDKKWEARGEQIQQLDFVAERKRWEAEKARQAPPEDDVIIDEPVFEDEQLPEWSSYRSQPEEEMMEAENMAAQEEYELQQLVALREQEEDAKSQHYGSDDDDYDSIFMECASSLEEQSQPQNHAQQQQTSQYHQDVEMDDIQMNEG